MKIKNHFTWRLIHFLSYLLVFSYIKSTFHLKFYPDEGLTQTETRRSNKIYVGLYCCLVVCSC